MISEEVFDGRDHSFDDTDFRRREEMIKKSLDERSWMYSKVRGATTDYCVEDCEKCQNTDCVYGRKRT